MLGFHKTVLSIAIILLVLILALIGYSLSYSETTNWPPIVGDCPDYWVDLSGNGEACYNSKSLGTCSLPDKNSKDTDVKITANFSSYTVCDKYNWSTSCGVTWDGITSGVLNPCDTSNTETDA